MTPVSGVIFSISIALGVHLTTFYTNLSRISAAWQNESWLHGLWKGAEGKLIKLLRKSINLTIKIAISQSGFTPLLRSCACGDFCCRAGETHPLPHHPSP